MQREQIIIIIRLMSKLRLRSIIRLRLGFDLGLFDAEKVKYLAILVVKDCHAREIEVWNDVMHA